MLEFPIRHSPDVYVETNIKGTLNVLQAARDFNVSKMIHTSTSEVYGTARFVPITEDHPLQGQSPYSATKIGADQLALSFFRSFDTPVAVARPFNTYGPRQSARAIIPTVITQIADGKKNIQVGSVYPTRDFNYVKDVAKGFAAVAESERSVGEVINLGSNFEISIRDTIGLIKKIMGVSISVVSDKNRVRPRKSEVDRLWASNAKAKRLLKWTPEYGGSKGLERGLAETIEWFRDPKNLQRYKSDIYNV